MTQNLISRFCSPTIGAADANTTKFPAADAAVEAILAPRGGAEQTHDEAPTRRTLQSQLSSKQHNPPQQNETPHQMPLSALGWSSKRNCSFCVAVRRGRGRRGRLVLAGVMCFVFGASLLPEKAVGRGPASRPDDKSTTRSITLACLPSRVSVSVRD